LTPNILHALWADGRRRDPDVFYATIRIGKPDLAEFGADFGRSDCDTGDACEGDLDNDNNIDGSDLATLAEQIDKTDHPQSLRSNEHQ